MLCPAHCLTWTTRYFLLLHHPFIHLPLSLSWQRAPPLLLHFCQCMSTLSFISTLPLSTIISPPWFSSSRRVHPPSLPLWEPTAINQLLVSSRGRLVSAASSISLSTVSCIHFLSTCDIVFAHACFAFVLPGWPPRSLIVFISPLDHLSNPFQINLSIKCICRFKKHNKNKTRWEEKQTTKTMREKNSSPLLFLCSRIFIGQNKISNYTTSVQC